MCGPGLEACSFQCVDKQSDAQHCGACGNACREGLECHEGVCVCPTGLTDCDNVCVDLTTDALNCGRCRNICESDETCE